MLCFNKKEVVYYFMQLCPSPLKPDYSGPYDDDVYEAQEVLISLLEDIKLANTKSLYVDHFWLFANIDAIIDNTDNVVAKQFLNECKEALTRCCISMCEEE